MEMRAPRSPVAMDSYGPRGVIWNVSRVILYNLEKWMQVVWRGGNEGLEFEGEKIMDAAGGILEAIIVSR